MPILLVALLLACLPSAQAASFEAVVQVDSMSVYAEKSPHALQATLPKGTVVTVNAWSGKAALISYQGTTGIARVSDMRRADAAEATLNRAMVTARDTRLYRRPDISSSYVVLPKGTEVTLLAISGSAARVSWQGREGYTPYSHLAEPQAAATPAPSTGTQSVTDIVETDNLAVVTTAAAQVYEGPYYLGNVITVPAGTKLTLVAYQGDWGMVTRNGAIGFMLLSQLQKDTAPKATQAPTDKNPFSAGSNERTIYAYLTGQMKLNRAAAMGVMANMYYESGYKTQIDGDSGTSYGLCQWHAGRKSNLINWCNDNGLDYNTLEGQLGFLNYELPTRYPSVYNYLKQVENTDEGAYDAAYYFCFNFEAPANRTAQSTKRGNYAKDVLFPKR